MKEPMSHCISVYPTMAYPFQQYILWCSVWYLSTRLKSSLCYDLAYLINVCIMYLLYANAISKLGIEVYWSLTRFAYRYEYHAHQFQEHTHYSVVVLQFWSLLLTLTYPNSLLSIIDSTLRQRYLFFDITYKSTPLLSIPLSNLNRVSLQFLLLYHAKSYW